MDIDKVLSSHWIFACKELENLKKTSLSLIILF